MRKKRYDIRIPNNSYGPLDSKIKDWLKANNIKSYSWFSSFGVMYISFKNEEDAVAFKLDYM